MRDSARGYRPELLGDQAARPPSLHRGSEVMREISGVVSPAHLDTRDRMPRSSRLTVHALTAAAEMHPP
jgi:hypothetical protein